ncbi:hypothetical protein CCMSSC00406_0009627 [Pleurotus cornucopiae]|uniref:Uncharacterized protein n=1 Tax=Pleurotus cornucopiae TaxID=5321 RepID=A0ACB7JA10_PLECO|nr:hypothetical protein CCMSSC00406_0009627 [Pleurotus cornucopiae]
MSCCRQLIRPTRTTSTATTSPDGDDFSCGDSNKDYTHTSAANGRRLEDKPLALIPASHGTSRNNWQNEGLTGSSQVRESLLEEAPQTRARFGLARANDARRRPPFPPSRTLSKASHPYAVACPLPQPSTSSSRCIAASVV